MFILSEWSWFIFTQDLVLAHVQSYNLSENSIAMMDTKLVRLKGLYLFFHLAPQKVRHYSNMWNVGPRLKLLYSAVQHDVGHSN